MTPKAPRKLPRLRMPSRFSAVSWRDLAITMGPVIIVSVIAIWAAFTFVKPAPDLGSAGE